MYVDARRRAEQVKETLQQEGVGLSPKTAEQSITE